MRLRSVMNVIATDQPVVTFHDVIFLILQEVRQK